MAAPRAKYRGSSPFDYALGRGDGRSEGKADTVPPGGVTTFVGLATPIKTLVMGPPQAP